MCLAVPGEILSLQTSTADAEDAPDFLRLARVRFGGPEGIEREISLAYVPEAQPGDFVLVHVGFALSRLNAQEAQALLAELDQLEEPLPPGATEDSHV